MPRYVHFPRSSVAGAIPSSIDPGSFSINWADRRIYVGGPNREPILMSYRLSDHDETRSYRREDIVYFKGSLWRCDVDFTTGPFVATQWIELTDISEAPFKELSGTVWVSGGTISPGVSNDLIIGAGEGVVMDLTNPSNPIISPVSWPQITISPPFTPNQTIAVGINGNGAPSLVNFEDSFYAWNREHIGLGWFRTDNTGKIYDVANYGINQHQVKETLADFLRAVGAFKISGADMTFSGTSQIRISSGLVFAQGLKPLTPSPNVIEVPVTQTAPVHTFNRTGITDVVPRDSLDVANWDDGGALEGVPAGKFTVQFLYVSETLADVAATYGQQLYDSLDAALSEVAIAYDQLVVPPSIRPSILLGAVASNADGTSQSIVNSDVGFGAPFTGTGGAGDTSQFLLISGIRAMTGNLDLGGNKIIDGFVDGADITIQPATSTQSGSTIVAEEREISVNVPDQKLFSGIDVIADRTSTYSASKLYALEDTCYQSNNLYVCTTAVTTPEAFDPAKWQLIGADNAGNLAQAVVIDPTTVNRNTINVSGQSGAVSALKFEFTNDQSVDLAEFSPNAKISRFGIPTGAFGEDVFRVSQVNHLFTAVGTPVFFTGTSWQLADNTAPSRFPQAVVHEVIDTDNVLLQVGGRINNLDPNAFVGSVAPTAGTFYYASDTAGRLTNVEGTTPVPVLYAISATQGLIKLTGTRIPEVLTPTDVIDLVYPVGSTYISIDPANPSLRWVGTTWVAEAEGRALVGVGNNGESEWTAGQQRGSETHTLTGQEMPQHDHAATITGSAITDDFNKEYSFEIRATGAGAGGTVYNGADVTITEDGAIERNFGTNSPSVASSKLTWDANHGHTVDPSGLSVSIESKGGGQPHNNIQPSLGIYIWRRTA